MILPIYPLMNKDQLGIFRNTVFTNYMQGNSLAQALEWATLSQGDEERFFPQVVVIGQFEHLGFQNEEYLGKFVYIQPGVIMFFPSDQLPGMEGELLCGNAFLSKITNYPLIDISLYRSESKCHILEDDGKIFFNWHPKFEGENIAIQYLLSEKMYKKIKSLFITTSDE